MKKIAFVIILYFFVEIFVSMIVMIALDSASSGDIQSIMFLPIAINYGLLFLSMQLLSAILFFTIIIKGFFYENPFHKITRFKPSYFLSGLLIGFSILTLVSFVKIKLGMQSYQINHWNAIYLIKGILLTFLISIKEEIIFRGFLLVSLGKYWGRIKAILASSILFGFVHIFTSHFDFFAFVQIFAVGIFLCVAFYKLNNLWLPIGIHMGWNFFLLFIYNPESNNFTAPFIIGKEIASPTTISILEIALLSLILILFYRINRRKLRPQSST